MFAWLKKLLRKCINISLNPPGSLRGIPISLYIHTPWCVRKCPYCDFNSHALKGEIPERNYLEVLLKDWELKRSALERRQLSSIFIGGGTPSLLSPQFYTDLFSEIKSDFSSDIEITLEANPGTVEQARFEGFRLAGINRISIGIQSFDPAQLKTLGRIHNSDDAKNAIMAAKNAGFNNINIDLMHGLPNQSLEEALQDLKIAFSFDTTHLSWYQLTLEPNTLFHRFPPRLPEDDVIAMMQEKGRDLLSAHGFDQYEVSAYARRQQYCRHNMNYWEFGDYIGIGAGAHGKISSIKSGEIKRYSNVKHPTQYLMGGNLIQEEKNISREELPLEFMLNALRLYKPIPIALFTERTGLSLKEIEKPLEKSIKENLLTVTADHITTTPLGKKFLNDLLENFLP
jgi:putative oxygen-independent coproporphyrinogen III oxidase